MPHFYCNSCTIPLRVTSVPESASSYRSNGTDNSMGVSAKSYVTNCKHLFCQACKEKCQRSCIKCHKTPCKMLEINENMPSHLHNFFKSVDEARQQIEKYRQFQLEQNEIISKQLAKTTCHYRQAYVAEEHNSKVSRKHFQDAHLLNRILKCVYRIYTNRRKRTLVSSRNVQHQQRPNQYWPGHHSRSEYTPDRFNNQHYGYAHDTPGMSSINSSTANRLQHNQYRRSNAFMHSTPKFNMR